MNRTSARIGYARVSTADQNLDAQLAALQIARCTMVRTEAGDGATLAGRPKLGTILDFIHPGETLVVTRIDRLARSMRDLQLIVATLKDKGAHLAATEQPVDISTAAGKAFFDMLGVFAEFETNLRRERQAEGIAAARQRGTYRGRPPRIDMEAIKQRLATGLSPTAIARELKVSRGTVYKARAAMTDGAWTRLARFGFAPRNVVIHLEVGNRRSVRVGGNPFRVRCDGVIGTVIMARVANSVPRGHGCLRSACRPRHACRGTCIGASADHAGCHVPGIGEA